jgi:hypothetical protein
MKKVSGLVLFLGFFVLLQFGFVWTLLHVDRKRNQSDPKPPLAATTSETPCPTCQLCVPPALVRPAEPPLFSLTVIVFTYNRIGGLRTLLHSLVAADFLGRTDIRLHVFLDYPKKPETRLDGTREYLDSFVWPHGPFDIHRRLANAGLRKTIMESWYPRRDDEVAAFFEDDIEVSREWFRWVDGGMRAYFGAATVDPKLLGLSLYRPIHDELSGRDVRKPTNDGSPFLLQQPCSWGAVFFPQPWRKFRQWYDEHRSEPAELIDPQRPGVRPSSNTWDSASSWKKYLIKLMYSEGWFMVYPNFGVSTVLSTNHLLPGVHNTPPKDLFELPLVPPLESMTDDDKRVLALFPPLESLVTYDVMFKKVSSLAELHGYR